MIFWDPNKQVFFFCSVLLNVTWMTGYWRTGLSIITLIIAATVGVQYYNSMKVISPSKDLSILITGTSTGIGEAALAKLTDSGFHVFAAQRKIDGKKNSDSVTYIALDVENEESMVKCVETIKQSKRTLFALVNNAGISCEGMSEFISMEEVRKSFEVNVFGLFRLTQLCIPLLRECSKKHHNAKVINLSSMAGLLALPGYAPYCASKWAVQALTAVLRNELAKFQIRVCGIHPGFVKTEFQGSALKRFEDGVVTDEKLKELYPNFVSRFIEKSKERKGFITPQQVAELLDSIMVMRVPKEVNVIGNETPQLGFLLSLPKILQNQIVRRVYSV
jgi:NAD(P)-dependent dehydrogenase (short-subunit alcohol dehydrogenase family)